MQHTMHSRQHAAPAPHLSELLGFDTLIRLGILDSEERLALAVQATHKARRFASGSVHLLVATDTLHAPAADTVDATATRHSPMALSAALKDYHARGKLLLPCLNEDFGDAFLHAVASGVPLGALNYRRPVSRRTGALPRSGDAFLGIG